MKLVERLDLPPLSYDLVTDEITVRLTKIGPGAWNFEEIVLLDGSTCGGSAVIHDEALLSWLDTAPTTSNESQGRPS